MNNSIQGTYDLHLILIALVAGVFASYTALSLLPLSMQKQDQQRRLWLLLSSVSLGLGIWTLHFISMIAFSLPVETKYNGLFTIMSIGPAIFASGQAFFLVVEAEDPAKVNVAKTSLCSILVGLGIATMHYVGMAAMHMDKGQVVHATRVCCYNNNNLEIIMLAKTNNGQVKGQTKDKQTNALS